MSAARAAAFVGLAWAGLLVLASLEALVPGLSSLPVPELGLLLVLYLGLRGRGGTAQLVAAALAIGYLVDLMSGSPRGLHALSLAVVMVIARGASNRLLVASRWQQALVTLAAALGHAALLCALSAPAEPPPGLIASRLWAVPGAALVTALCAPLTFAALARLDRRLQPRPGRLGSAGGI